MMTTTQEWLLPSLRFQDNSKDLNYERRIQQHTKKFQFEPTNLTHESKGINNKAAWSSYVCAVSSVE